jgi:hypothetical protein
VRRAADDGVSDQLRIERRQAIHRGPYHVREHIIGTDVPHDPAGLPDRRSDGGDEIGILNRIDHFSLPAIIEIFSRLPADSVP